MSHYPALYLLVYIAMKIKLVTFKRFREFKNSTSSPGRFSLLKFSFSTEQTTEVFVFIEKNVLFAVILVLYSLFVYTDVCIHNSMYYLIHYLIQ